jgi:hypothetical protein
MSDQPAEQLPNHGPHGIPLVEHARAGGDEAREVLALLESIEVRG